MTGKPKNRSLGISVVKIQILTMTEEKAFMKEMPQVAPSSKLFQET